MAFGGPPPLLPLFRSDGSPEDLPSIIPENYRSEVKRQKSFMGRALNGITAEKLARAGYFYTGEEDMVQCFKCRVTCSKWRQGDDPFTVHQQCNPFCPFLQEFAKPPDSQVVLSSNVTVPTCQKRMSLPVQTDEKDIACASDHQLYREMTLWRLHSSVDVQSMVLSFPPNSTVDHNPIHGLAFEDNGAVHSPSCDLTIPPQHPSPAQLPPVQSTQATDHSAVLVGNVSMPLQTHRYSAGVYKYPIQGNTSVGVNTFDDNDKKLDHGKDEGKVCRICLSAAIECVYVPCGHTGACRSCVNEFKKTSSCCPFCNTCAISTPNIYFP